MGVGLADPRGLWSDLVREELQDQCGLVAGRDARSVLYLYVGGVGKARERK